jgi:hypothetical protein
VVKRLPHPAHSRRRRTICSSSLGRVSTTLSSVAEQKGQRMVRNPGVFYHMASAKVPIVVEAGVGTASDASGRGAGRERRRSASARGALSVPEARSLALNLGIAISTHDRSGSNRPHSRARTSRFSVRCSTRHRSARTERPKDFRRWDKPAVAQSRSLRSVESTIATLRVVLVWALTESPRFAP